MSKKCETCDGLGYKVIGVEHNWIIISKKMVPYPQLRDKYGNSGPEEMFELIIRKCSVCHKSNSDGSRYCSYPHIMCNACNGKGKK